MAVIAHSKDEEVSYRTSPISYVLGSEADSSESNRGLPPVIDSSSVMRRLWLNAKSCELRSKVSD